MNLYSVIWKVTDNQSSFENYTSISLRLTYHAHPLGWSSMQGPFYFYFLYISLGYGSHCIVFIYTTPTPHSVLVLQKLIFSRTCSKRIVRFCTQSDCLDLTSWNSSTTGLCANWLGLKHIVVKATPHRSIKEWQRKRETGSSSGTIIRWATLIRKV